MNKILRLDDRGVRSLLKHPLLADKKIIGRGTFSAVFENDNGGVSKLTADGINYDLFNSFMAVEGVHFPRVTNSHNDVGEIKFNGDFHPIYLYEMERLQKLKPDTESKRVAKCLSKDCVPLSLIGPNKATYFEKFESIAEKWAVGFPSLHAALMELSQFASNYDNAEIDIHMANVMQRANGELVLVDPLCDWTMLRKHSFYVNMAT